MSFFRRLSRRSTARQRPAPRGKEGARLYAIGDVHGCLDLLDSLLAKIEADAASREVRKTYIVFLGDLIDRGPASAGVLDRLRTYRPEGATPIFLAGNHEEIFQRIVGGESDILADWLKFGGSECLESYGLDPAELGRIAPGEAVERIRSKVPQEHVDFIDGFADTFRFGDYLLVHAGIRPGLELHEQEQFDLRWIREPFLSFEDEHGLVVVHGHTIVDQVDERPNRIGLDTGAYRTGVLTALVIEDDARWYLSTTGAGAPGWAKESTGS
ncbi:metallophosphoesterase family protein [Sphingosinicella terrae]|jgi:serine/threonine protein phosphatase 1|uniref:metallophosphoesterase family protein n=1 Tax=Sphingosinicella terrae TaxID=2172047 RepID=UPI000E0CED7A|nr:metallophosphoesterase family protein [Sphingosinicella terrae]